MEIRALGGAGFARVLADFRAGRPVTYRGMELTLRPAGFECRVTLDETSSAPPGRWGLAQLLEARFKLGALLASAAPLADIVGNREPRYVLVRDDASGVELAELRGDRFRRLNG